MAGRIRAGIGRAQKTETGTAQLMYAAYTEVERIVLPILYCVGLSSKESYCGIPVIIVHAAIRHTIPPAHTQKTRKMPGIVGVTHKELPTAKR